MNALLAILLLLLTGCAPLPQSHVASADVWFTGNSQPEPQIISLPAASIERLSPSVDLAWDDPESGMQHRIYWGTSSQSYGHVLDVGTNCSATVWGLELGRTYYFAVTASDINGIESEPSRQLALAARQTLKLHFNTPGDRLIASTNLQEWHDRPAQWLGDSWRVAVNPNIRQEFFRSISP